MTSLKEQFAQKKQKKQLKQNLNEFFSLGIKYAEQLEFDKAIEIFTQLIGVESHATIYFNRGICYEKLGKYELALTDFNKVIQLSPKDYEAYCSRGDSYKHLGKYELALIDYNQAVQLNPNYVNSYNSRAICYTDLGKYDLALTDLNTAIQLNPNCAEPYCNRGRCYTELRKYELALTDLNKAIQLNPNGDITYNNRGMCYASLKNYDLALADYNKAIYLNSYCVDYYNNRGSCYADLEKHELALADYNKAIELDSNYAKAYVNRGVYYDMLYNYELALADYNKAIELNPCEAATYSNRGRCYAELENYELALNDLDEAIKLFNSSEYKKQSCFSASHIAVTAKKYNKARDYIEQGFEQADSKEQQHKNIYLKSIESAEELDRKNQQLEELNIELEKKNKQLELEIQEKQEALEREKALHKQLQAKEKELEDMMSMFAHKFRSPLDAIIYNTSHDKDTKLYTESANTMRGLLDIFSIISADDKILTDKIKNDNKGNATLISVLNKTLNMTLLHLLSVSGMSKIHQHYMSYAKAQGKITDAISYKEWCDDYFEMEGELQKQWEQEFSVLLHNNASLAERLQWVERYFFKLNIIGFEIETIQFKEYETTESFLFILMNEILLNAFKYYASENKQPVILEWTATENDQILSCRNPSIRRERDQHKGSGKGHTFLSALARKTTCKFTKPKLQDDFVLEFAIPNELLLSN